MRNLFRSKRHDLLYLIGFLLLIPALSAADSNRAKKVGSKLMCICGCGQVLTECNHNHCPSSVPMRKELDDRLAAGLSDAQVIQAFVEKYGTIVRAAPGFSGWFNKFAWSITFVLLAAGGAGLVIFLRRVKAPPLVPAAPLETATYDRKIEDELRRFTPED